MTRPSVLAAALVSALVAPAVAADEKPRYVEQVLELSGGQSLQGLARVGSGSVVLKFDEGHVRVASGLVVRARELTQPPPKAERFAEGARFRRDWEDPAALQRFLAPLPAPRANAYLLRCLLGRAPNRARDAARDLIKQRPERRFLLELAAFGASSSSSARFCAKSCHGREHQLRSLLLSGGALRAGFRFSGSGVGKLHVPEGKLYVPVDRLRGAGPPDEKSELPALPKVEALSAAIEAARPEDATTLVLRAFLAGGPRREAVRPLLLEPGRLWLLRLVARRTVEPREAAFAADAMLRALAEGRWTTSLVQLEGCEPFLCEAYETEHTLHLRLGPEKLDVPLDLAVRVEPLKGARAAEELVLPAEVDTIAEVATWVADGDAPVRYARQVLGLLSRRGEVREATARLVLGEGLDAGWLLDLVLRRSDDVGAVETAARALLSIRDDEAQGTFLRLCGTHDRWRAAIAMRALNAIYREAGHRALPLEWTEELRENDVRLAMLRLTVGDDAGVQEQLRWLISERSQDRLKKVLELVAAARRPFRVGQLLEVAVDPNAHTVQRLAALEAIRVSRDLSVVPALIARLQGLGEHHGLSTKGKSFAGALQTTLRALTETDRDREAWEWADWLEQKNPWLETLSEDAARLADASAPVEARLAACTRLKRLRSNEAVWAALAVLRVAPGADVRVHGAAIGLLAEQGLRREMATQPLAALLEDERLGGPALLALRRIYGPVASTPATWERVLVAHGYNPPLRALLREGK